MGAPTKNLQKKVLILKQGSFIKHQRANLVFLESNWKGFSKETLKIKTLGQRLLPKM